MDESGRWAARLLPAPLTPPPPLERCGDPRSANSNRSARWSFAAIRRHRVRGIRDITRNFVIDGAGRIAFLPRTMTTQRR